MTNGYGCHRCPLIRSQRTEDNDIKGSVAKPGAWVPKGFTRARTSRISRRKLGHVYLPVATYCAQVTYKQFPLRVMFSNSHILGSQEGIRTILARKGRTRKCGPTPGNHHPDPCNLPEVGSDTLFFLCVSKSCIKIILLVMCEHTSAATLH